MFVSVANTGRGTMTRALTRRQAGLGAVAAATAAGIGTAGAADTVKIGIILPLSGGAASAGEAGKAAVEVALDVINNSHPELGNLTLAKDAGLPNLGGAKVE